MKIKIILIVLTVFFAVPVHAFDKLDKAKAGIELLVKETEQKIKDLNQTLDDLSKALDALAGDKGSLGNIQTRNADLTRDENNKIALVYGKLRTLFGARIPEFADLK